MGGAAVGADAAVNLAGASIAEARWNAQRKMMIRASRVSTTRSLVAALAKMAIRPRVLVSASAIGYYGDRGDELLNEGSDPGSDFLSEIAKEWEGEALKAEALGIRVVCVRFGIILAKNGGALPKMVKPFKLGVGGKIGSGQQWMSWISLVDVVGILRLALEDGSVRGPIKCSRAAAREECGFHTSAGQGAAPSGVISGSRIRVAASAGRNGRRAAACQPACPVGPIGKGRLSFPVPESAGRARSSAVLSGRLTLQRSW